MTSRKLDIEADLPGWLRCTFQCDAALRTVLIVAAQGLVVGIFALMFAEVLSRYALGVSLLITWEFSAYFLGWLIFLGAADTASCGKHVRVTLLVEHCGPRLMAAIEVTGYAVALIACGLLAWALVGFAWDAFERETVTQTISEFPVFLIHGVSAVGAIAVCFTLSLSIVRCLLGIETRRRDPESKLQDVE